MNRNNRRIWRRCIAQAAAVALLAGLPVLAPAADETPPPPYQYRAFNNVMVGVAYDEAAIRRVLPSGIKPVAGTTGGINITPSRDASGLGSHSGMYMWVDIEGFDGSGGMKGRWVVATVWSPAKVADAMRKYYGQSPLDGSSHLEFDGAKKTGVVTVNGKDIIRAEILTKPDCQRAAGTLYYPGKNGNGPVMVNEIPFMGEFCPADPGKVEFLMAADHPFAAFQPVKILWAGEFKEGIFSFSSPVPVR